VPDIAVIRWEQLPKDVNGEIADQFSCPPNWIIEILSPDQSATFLIEKIIFCLNAGTELGWLIDLSAKSVTLLQNGLPKVYGLAHNPQEPITVMAGLENWQITVAELFDWLKV
jgi:Uma2 family endonuclease